MVGQAMEIQGIDVLTRRLDALGLDVRSELSSSGERGGLVIEAAAKSKVRVRSGNLRDHITTVVEQDGEDLVVKVGTKVFYGVYIEFGTGIYAEGGDGRQGGWWYIDEDGEWRFTMGSHPYPFLRPAFDENQDRAAQVIIDGLEAAIRRAIAS